MGRSGVPPPQHDQAHANHEGEHRKDREDGGGDDAGVVLDGLLLTESILVLLPLPGDRDGVVTSWDGEQLELHKLGLSGCEDGVPLDTPLYIYLYFFPFHENNQQYYM